MDSILLVVRKGYDPYDDEEYEKVEGFVLSEEEGIEWIREKEENTIKHEVDMNRAKVLYHQWTFTEIDNLGKG